MISYYELLGMIKEDKAPKKIMVHLTSKPKMYKAVYDFGDFNYYTLYEEEIIDDDYKYYLSECFLESSMFDKNIEILDKKRINDKSRFQYSQIPSWLDKKEMIKTINENFEKHQKAINEIINKLEKKLHANKIVFNCDNNKRECVINLDENDLGIDKLHIDNCYFYKENDKWYVRKYDFKTFNLEEKKIPEKLNYPHIEIESSADDEIRDYLYKVKDKFDEIIDYLQSKGDE